MKQIVTGIVAHVDAGKTTLSEALLYQTGALRQLGRVDHGDAFLDSDDLEKKRGITIFSHQANLTYRDLQLTLLDTPGHVDFANQTEAVLSVLDYAILVVSAQDGVQGYTRTLWQLLAHYHVPTFIFVNKIDVAGFDRTQMLSDLQREFSEGCLPFATVETGEFVDDINESLAMCDEKALDEFVTTGQLTDTSIRQMIVQRQVFPCYFGAALKLTGVTDFLAGIARWAETSANAAISDEHEAFGARVFKITHDHKGERLTWIRLTQGTLSTKALIADEKVNQIRVYNGTKFILKPVVHIGEVCALTGLTTTYQNQGLGQQADGQALVIRPVLNYALDPKGQEIQACLAALRQLEDENPQLHVTWSEHLQEIHVALMGEVQLEILEQILQERFKLPVGFDEGHILYQETITAAIEGVGHFEPLRHYAEVHLRLEPAEHDQGVIFASECSLENLSRNWQHQVLTSLAAKEHLGVLTGSPLTAIKMTLINGRASNVHTVGGDFREATWRAVRQGLMMAKMRGTCQLLEPWYRFRLEVTQDQVGRAMNDIQRMSGTFEPVESGHTDESLVSLTGFAPVSEMRGYAQEVYAYTHGQGQLTCLVDGYRPCHNADEIEQLLAYEPVSDLENTPDSVFCAHGAGYPVAWNQVPQAAHLPYAPLS